MDIINFFKTKIFTTTGRLNRMSYIKYFFGLSIFSVFVGGLLLFAVESIMGTPDSVAQKVLGYAFNLICFAGYVCLVMRRLHDLNKDNWLAVLTLIPVVNLVFGIYLMVMRGTVGQNKYGEDPLMND